MWPGGVPSPTLRRRIEWAIRLYQEGGHDRLLVSGGLGASPPTEADVMARIALDAGIPADRIIYDRDARTTIDTAAFAAGLNRDRTIAFTAVTDRYHALRTRLAFRTFGLRVSISWPPRAAGTNRLSLIRSYMREAPALVLYAAYFGRARMLAREPGSAAR